MKPLVLNPFFFLSSLYSAWMMGIGFRFLMDGYINMGIYTVNGFDAVFDWGMLTILGVCLFIYGVHHAIRQNFKEDY